MKNIIKSLFCNHEYNLLTIDLFENESYRNKFGFDQTDTTYTLSSGKKCKKCGHVKDIKKVK